MTNPVKAWPIAGRTSSHRFISDSPFVCNIFSHGLLRSERCFAPEGDGGGGGGGDGEQKLSITQKEIDAMMGRRLAEERKKYEGHEDFKAQAAKAKEFEAELVKLREETELAGKSAEERERIAAEKARKTMERSVEEATTKQTAAEKRAEAAEQRYRDSVIERGLSGGLDAGKVLQSAKDDAVDIFRRKSKVEIGDDGKITEVMYGGLPYKTAAEAAVAFMKDHPHFAPATGGGGGSRPPNAGGGRSGVPLHEQSEDDLLRAASRAR
jgi:hypothetical protein